MTGFAVEMEDNSETTMNEDILAAEVNEAIDAGDDEGENHETSHAAVVKKKKPSGTVGWSVGDVCRVRWCHPDSKGSSFRGNYYIAKIIEVHTNSDGIKSHTVKYDDDEDAIETNVNHLHTMSLK